MCTPEKEPVTETEILSKLRGICELGGNADSAYAYLKSIFDKRPVSWDLVVRVLNRLEIQEQEKIQFIINLKKHIQEELEKEKQKKKKEQENTIELS